MEGGAGVASGRRAELAGWYACVPWRWGAPALQHAFFFVLFCVCDPPFWGGLRTGSAEPRVHTPHTQRVCVHTPVQPALAHREAVTRGVRAAASLCVREKGVFFWAAPRQRRARAARNHAWCVCACEDACNTAPTGGGVLKKAAQKHKTRGCLRIELTLRQTEGRSSTHRTTARGTCGSSIRHAPIVFWRVTGSRREQF